MKIKLSKQLTIAFVFNLIIVGLEIIGLVLSVNRHGIKVFCFYTENSNYFALIVSFVFCISYLFNKTTIKTWLIAIRFISTVCLTITLIIVLCVLVPMYPSNFVLWMFKTSNLYQHLLCPVLSIVSFLWFEPKIRLKKNIIIFALIPTIIYGCACIILNLLKIITGPYPFFYVYALPWYVTVCSLFGVLTIAILITIIIFYVHNKPFKKQTFLKKSNNHI